MCIWSSVYLGDIVDDAIYNFSRVYQQYALQGDASEDEQQQEMQKRESPSTSDEAPGAAGNKKKRGSPKGSEKVSLLVGSDEEEIF